MNMQSTLAGMIRKSSADVVKAAQELGDKIEWKPLDKGRSALDQVQECAGITNLTAMILETQTVPTDLWAALSEFRAAHDTAEKTTAKYTETSEKVAHLLETLSPEALAQTVTLPMGGGMVKTLVEVSMMTYWNNVYHEGQINYIQTLCAE